MTDDLPVAHLAMTDEEKAAVAAYNSNPAIMALRIGSGCPDCAAVTHIERDPNNERRSRVSVLHNSSCPPVHPVGGV